MKEKQPKPHTNNIIAQIAQKTKVRTIHTDEILSAMFLTMKEYLCAGESLGIENFGHFWIKGHKIKFKFSPGWKIINPKKQQYFNNIKKCKKNKNHG